MNKDEKSKTHFPKLSKTGSSFRDSEDNPFYVPDDSEIFRMNDIDKERKKQQRRQHQSLRIWEKGGKQKSGLTMKDLREMGKTETEEEPVGINRISLMQAAKSAIKNRVKVNQPMHQYIDKKREMLLFQMLIDHKREQINQYEQLTRRHKKGLAMAEQYLEQDTQSFNNYLNQNKVEARKAIKDAQEKTRLKNQKIAILKVKLEVKADLTGKNTSKEETVQNLLKYKDFLDSLLHSSEAKQKKKKSHINLNHNITNPQILQLLEQQDENEDMVFKNPAQLMNIFVNLEEQNLFLMGNLKTIEQNIEIVRGGFNAKKKVLDAKKQQLLNSKAQLMKQINGIDKEIQHIKSLTNKQDSGELVNNLEAEIIRSCRQFGQKGFSDQKFMGIEFLKDIQKRLQSQIKFISDAREEKPSLIQNIQKNCSNDRRQKKKLKNEDQLKQLALQQRIQEISQRDKRHGRPIMAKSKLKVEQKEVKVEDEGPKEEQIQRRKYLT